MSAAAGAAPPTRAGRLHVLLALARADFLERVRRHGFLITLAVAAWGAHGALPPRGAGYTTVALGGYRPLYNSAGAGTIVAFVTGVFLALAGFYLVKGSIQRDRRTGVGEVLASTPMGRLTYVVAKLLSNAAVLFAMVGVMIVVAGVMQQVLGEDPRVDPVALVLPFLLLTGPAMLLVAALAVLFEVIPALRGGFGHVVYFFLWILTIAIGTPEIGSPLPIGDLIGFGTVMPSLEQTCEQAHPDYHAGRGQYDAGIHISPRARSVTPFAWPGVRWTARLLAQRLAWVALAAILALVAAGLFDRFDTARDARGWRFRRRQRGSATTAPAWEPQPSAAANSSVTRIAAAPRAERFTPLLRAELAVLLKGLSRWWYAGALALAALCLFVPLAGVRSVVLPLAAIWPLLLWSTLGCREIRHGTHALLFCAPHPLRRQLLATWLAGVLLALAATGTYALRIALTGDAGALSGWLAGVLFVPSFALACGVWTGSGKLFEVAFLALWYVGPLQRTPALDLLGAVSGAHAAHTAFFALAPALLGLAYAGRARQLRG